MARGRDLGQHGQAAVDRGMQAEESFRKLLGGLVTKSGKFTDRIEHYDFNVKFDVKKIRSVDEFGESNYHWIELVNVTGNAGWLYGSADYIAFETVRYWIIVDILSLRKLVDKKVLDVNTEISPKKEPYRIYRRHGRFDKIVMVPTLDLAYLGFMVEKENA